MRTSKEQKEAISPLDIIPEIQDAIDTASESGEVVKIEICTASDKVIRGSIADAKDCVIFRTGGIVIVPSSQIHRYLG